jgi:VCBS repeat-containing protein
MLAGDLDFGDAPDLGPGTAEGDYTTLAEYGGPSHVVSGALYMGTQPDPDGDGQPDRRAGGDDYEAGLANDEDGIRSPLIDLGFTVTSSPTVSIVVTNTTNQPAVLTGWVDFNGDGSFDDATERASTEIGWRDPVSGDAVNAFRDSEPVVLQFPKVLTSYFGQTYARFRLGLLDDEAAATSTGPGGVGEVEDYVAQVHRPSTGIAHELQYYADRNNSTRPFVSEQYSFSYDFGTSVVSVGDLDGNDVNDLAVGVPNANMDGVGTGAVHVFFMEEDGSYSKRTIIGPDAGFGSSTAYEGYRLRLASLGDLDEDGINELAVSYGLVGNQQPISLHTLYLNSDGAAKLVKPITTDVGVPVGYLGDIDGNGTIELAVKNPYTRESFQILSLNSQAQLVKTSEIFNGDVSGESPDGNDSFGTAVEPVGDLDGNETIDLAVGVGLGGHYDAGQVQILLLDSSDGSFTVSQRTELTRSTDDASVGFGNAIAAIGDLDGDDITELVIGDPTLRDRSYPDGEPTSSQRGAAYVVFLTKDGTVKRLGPHPLGTISSVSKSERYGTSIEVLGDLSDDGSIEIAIGAPGFANNTGIVDIVSLNLDGERIGGNPIGPFGTRGQSSSVVTSLGDIDGNGYQDMAVAAGTTIQILLAGAQGQVIATRAISGSDAGIGSFGLIESLSSAGDIDGDGIQELAVGSPSPTIDRFSEDVNGVARILFLNADGSLRELRGFYPSPNIGPNDDNYDPAYLNFGHAITSPGDLDGNGVPDLLVAQGGFTRRRSTHIDVYPPVIDVLLMQRDGNLLDRKQIEGKGGTDLTAVGDLNKDGYPDVVVGAPTTLEVLLLGKDGSLVESVPYSFPDADDFYNLGTSVSYVGDLNADSVPDLLVGGFSNDKKIGVTEIISLNPDGTVNTRFDPDIPRTFAYRGQGRAFTPLGDVNGDGVIDFAMAAPPRNTEYVPEGGLFVMGLEEQRLGDFGDAPDNGSGTRAFNYQTHGGDNGPLHFVDQRLRLGQLVTDDIEVKPDVEADQDDDDGVVDQNDLHLTGAPVIGLSVTNETTEAAMLYGWIDTNFDGSFDETERVSASVPAGAVDQTISLQFTKLPAGLSGTTYARFRLSTDEAASQSTGSAADGEVEDYRVTIDTPPLLGVSKALRLKSHSQDFGFGVSVAHLGDLDNNGFDDYAVGSVSNDRLSILLMASEDVVEKQIDHSSPRFDRFFSFGVSVAPIGDLNGDGVIDIAVGANGERSVSGIESGALHILFLNSDGTEKSRTIITDGVDGAPALSENDHFGSSVTTVGDLNDDGVVDLAVGAQRDGAVYTLFMNSDGTVQSFSKIARNVGGGPSLPGNSYFGASVAGLGDWNGDGTPDLLVGANQETFYEDGVLAYLSGAAYLLELKEDGTAQNVTKLNASDGIEIDADDYFGSSVAMVGDLDRNGVNDIAVGAVRDEPGLNHGAVHLILFNADGTVKDSVKIGDQLNGGPDLKVRENRLAYFGSALATLPDRDGNGLPELAIGARADNPLGGVYVTYLTGEFFDYGDAPILADAEIESSHTSVFDLQVPIDEIQPSGYKSIGDINNDGVLDYGTTFTERFMVGNYQYYRYGFAVILMNADGTVASTQQHIPDLDWAVYSGGSPGRQIGDLDGDGVTDITLSYRARDGEGYGLVHILYMNMDGTVRETAVISPSSIPGLPISDRDRDREEFGISVSGIGDLNNDGTRDLAVGSTSFGSAGDVYIFFMNQDGTVQGWNIVGTGAGNSPDDLRSNFGYSVANLGDFDGDGVNDLLVGAPHWTPTGLGRSGAAYLMFMNADGTYHSYQRLEEASGLPLQEDDRFGQAVAPIGDVDGDGVTDIAVGSIRDDDGGNNNGSVYIVLLNSDGTPKSWSLITSGIGGGPESSKFGGYLSVLGDKDDNGITELLVQGSGGPFVVNLAPAETDYPEATSDLPPSHSTDAEVFLGAAVDVEPRHLDSAEADWDDTTAPINDADGLIDPTQLSSFIAGSPLVVDVLATNRSDEVAHLHGWIDFNGNKLFDVEERVSAVVDPDTIAAAIPLSFPVPTSLTEGSTYARFRISSDIAASAPTGHAVGGEVEDYSTSITIIDTDYGDAPNRYKTLSTSAGPSHLVNDDVYMGLGVDVELEANPGPTARSDKDDGLASTDLTFVSGERPAVDVRVTNNTASPAQLFGWIDYLADGTFGSDEQTMVVIPPNFSGTATLIFPMVPPNALGSTYARFRLSTDPTLSGPFGPARDGEVEDYRATIFANDYSDAAPTYEIASHFVVEGLSIGAAVDREINAVQSPDANSDDLIGFDDEDGFDGTGVYLTPGQPPSLSVDVTRPSDIAPKLYGWIDMDGDGSFADEETAVRSMESLPAGTHTVDLNWTKPIPDGANGIANVRFRVSTDNLEETPGGHASNGEVEDHQVFVRYVDLGDAPDPVDAADSTSSGNYQTRLADDGPSHTIDSRLYLGDAVIDNEADSDQTFFDENIGHTVQRLSANGDDVTGIDDEDGLVAAAEDLQLIVGEFPEVRIVATNLTDQMATVHGWIDFNQDGDFLDEGEHDYGYVPPGQENKLVTLEFPEVSSEHLGVTYARFRLTTDYALAADVLPTGPLDDGEVEDYVVTMSQPLDPSTLETKELKLLSSVRSTWGIDGDEFGTSVAALGNLDGDGGMDFAVGGPGQVVESGSYTTEGGTTFNVSPSPTVNGHVVSVDRQGEGGSHAISTLVWYNDSTYSGNLYGASLAKLGSAIVIGAPGSGEDVTLTHTDPCISFRQYTCSTTRYYDWQRTNRGAVSIRKILASGETEALEWYAPNVSDGDQFGWSIANVGRIDGDTIDDLAVGAPGDGSGEQGAVYILFMNSDGTVRTSKKIASGSGSLPNFLNTARFGTSVAKLDDGVIAVGTKEDSGLGSVYLLQLNQQAEVTQHSRIGTGTPGLGQLWRAKNGVGEEFGRSVVGVADLNGDDVRDLLVGSPKYGGRGAFRAVYLKPDFLSSDDNVKSTDLFSASHGKVSAEPGDEFGTSIAVLSAPDGAGRFEIVVGAPGYGNDVGAVWRMQMQSSVTPETLNDVVLNLPEEEDNVDMTVKESTVASWLAAIETLPEFPRPNETVTITLDVSASTTDYSGVEVEVPSGYQLKIVNDADTVTFTGASPALTVVSGDVVITGNVRFVNSTASPTIKVLGGTLSLRGVTVHETTGGEQAAIEVIDGVLDLGTVSHPGDNIINVNGSGTLIENSGAAIITAVGNTLQQDGADISDGFAIEEEITDYFETAANGAVLVYDDRYFDRTKIRVSDFDLQKLSADLKVTNPTYEILSSVAGTAELLADGKTVRFAADSSGLSSFTFAVIADNDVAGSRTVQLDVTNLPPEVELGEDQTGLEGDTFNFDGAYSDPGDNSVHRFAWAVTDAEGAVVAESAEQMFAFTPTDDGVYTVQYTVTDGVGESGSDELAVVAENVAPTAHADTHAFGEDDEARVIDVLSNDSDPAGDLDPLSVISVEASGLVGIVELVDGTISYDPAGRFESLAEGQSLTESFTYTISDGDGGSDTGTVSVAITGANDAPVATLDGSSGDELDDQVPQFSWNASDVDGNLDSVNVLVSKDGQRVESLSGVVDPSGDVDLNGQGLGLFEVTLTATDTRGAAATDTRTFRVSDDDNEAPTIAITGSSGTELEIDTNEYSWSVTDESGLSALSITVTRDSGDGPTVVYSTTDLADAVGTLNFDEFGVGVYEILVVATDGDDDWAGDAATNGAGRTSVVGELFLSTSTRAKLEVDDGEWVRLHRSDVTSTHDGDVLFDHSQLSPPWFSWWKPNLNAFHMLADGSMILSTDGRGNAGNQDFRDGGLVRFFGDEWLARNPHNPDQLHETAQMVATEQQLFGRRSWRTGVDAISISPDGDLVISLDRGRALADGKSYHAGDLIKIGLHADGTLASSSLYFDHQVLDTSGWHLFGRWFDQGINVDGAHVLEDGRIILSVSSTATVGDGGDHFKDGDVFVYDPDDDIAELLFDENSFRRNEEVDAVFLGIGNGELRLLDSTP